MKSVRNLAIVVVTALVVQMATIAATFNASSVDDWRQWAVGALVGVANAVGLAVLAWWQARPTTP